MPRKTLTTAAPDCAERVLAAARKLFLAHGYSALTMDELARELGMSKKTLYVHFASKDALIEEIFTRFADDVRTQAETIFADQDLPFTDKMHNFGEAMVRRLSQFSPHVLRDVQRFAPQIYQHFEELRNRNIPLIFGAILRQGQDAGIVRREINVPFAVEFWRSAIQSLLHPDSLERLQLTPRQTLTHAIEIFFGGLLTPAGCQEYEKRHAHSPR